MKTLVVYYTRSGTTAKAFTEMEEALGAKPASTLALQKHTVDGGEAQARVTEFAEALKAQGL